MSTVHPSSIMPPLSSKLDQKPPTGRQHPWIPSPGHLKWHNKNPPPSMDTIIHTSHQTNQPAASPTAPKCQVSRTVCQHGQLANRNSQKMLAPFLDHCPNANPVLI